MYFIIPTFITSILSLQQSTFKISVGNILTFKTFSKTIFLNEQEYTIAWIRMYHNTNIWLSRTIIPYHPSLTCMLYLSLSKLVTVSLNQVGDAGLPLLANKFGKRN